jgi:hypothetical protein
MKKLTWRDTDKFFPTKITRSINKLIEKNNARTRRAKARRDEKKLQRMSELSYNNLQKYDDDCRKLIKEKIRSIK